MSIEVLVWANNHTAINPQLHIVPNVMYVHKNRIFKYFRNLIYFYNFDKKIMMVDAQIRQQIFRKIRRIPSSKLNDLNDYLNKLEQTTDKSSKILSFAGSWVNIDKSAFDELTENLISNRSENSRRIDE